jgi:hypothetical protein
LTAALGAERLSERNMLGWSRLIEIDVKAERLADEREEAERDLKKSVGEERINYKRVDIRGSERNRGIGATPQRQYKFGFVPQNVGLKLSPSWLASYDRVKTYLEERGLKVFEDAKHRRFDRLMIRAFDLLLVITRIAKTMTKFGCTRFNHLGQSLLMRLIRLLAGEGMLGDVTEDIGALPDGQNSQLCIWRNLLWELKELLFARLSNLIKWPRSWIN